MSDITAPGGGGKSYQALGTAPELGGTLLAGKLMISGGSVRFEAAAGAVEWRLDEIRLSIGGHNDGQLFLTVALPSSVRQGDIAARADEVSRWILAEVSPLALPDSRWDKMVYGVRDCEEFLRAIR